MWRGYFTLWGRKANFIMSFLLAVRKEHGGGSFVLYVSVYLQSSVTVQLPFSSVTLCLAHLISSFSAPVSPTHLSSSITITCPPCCTHSLWYLHPGLTHTHCHIALCIMTDFPALCLRLFSRCRPCLLELPRLASIPR